MTIDTIHHAPVQLKDIAHPVTLCREGLACKIEYQYNSCAMLKFHNRSLALVLPKQSAYHFETVIGDVSSYGKAALHHDVGASVYIKDVNNVEMVTREDEAL